MRSRSGRNMTTLNFLLAQRRRAHAFARRRDRDHQPSPDEANASPWLLVAKDQAWRLRTDVDARRGRHARLLRTPRTSSAIALASSLHASAVECGVVLDHRARPTGGSSRWHEAWARSGGLTERTLRRTGGRPRRHGGRCARRRRRTSTSARTWGWRRSGATAVPLAQPSRTPPDEQPAGHRFETGTLCHEAIAGFHHRDRLHREPGAAPESARPSRRRVCRIGRHELRLTARTLERMAEIPGCHLYGVSDPAAWPSAHPTSASTSRALRPRELSHRLAQKGHLRLGRQLLRARRDAGARPRGHRRRGARRLPALHHRG